MNLPTIIIASIVALLFLAIIINGIRGRKKGKCSCGCEGCGMSDICHGKKKLK